MRYNNCILYVYLYFGISVHFIVAFLWPSLFHYIWSLELSPDHAVEETE